jgi:hypothetical protein
MHLFSVDVNVLNFRICLHYRFKQMIAECSKLRLSETLLGYSKVLPLIESCCPFGEIIVVGGGAKAIAL